MQMIMACIWLDKGNSKYNDWIKMASVAPDKLGKAWETGAEFVRAVNLDDLAMSDDDDLEAEKALIVVADNGVTNNETKATALLMLARRSAPDEGRGFLDKMPVQGAQHVRAIAGRLIA